MIWRQTCGVVRVMHTVRVSDESDEDLAFFRGRGYEVRFEQRDLHAEHMGRGEPGRATFFAEGHRYYCIDLLRDGRVVAPRYGYGETPEQALLSARRRYESEQGQLAPNCRTGAARSLLPVESLLED